MQCVRAKFLPGLAVVALLLAACDSSRDTQVAAAPAAGFTCTARASGVAGLPGEWQPFAADIDDCALHGADGLVALHVITVSASRFYARQSSGAATVDLPKPLIISATGKQIGRLPYNYPDDPPLASTLAFEDWRDGLPRTIRIAVTDPTVTGDHDLSMAWQESRGEYVGGTEEK